MMTYEEKDFGNFLASTMDSVYSQVNIRVTKGKYKDFEIFVRSIDIKPSEFYFDIIIQYEVTKMVRLYSVDDIDRFVNECVKVWVDYVLKKDTEIPEIVKN